MGLKLSPLTPEIMRARRDGMSGRELAHIVRGVDLRFEPPEFNIITDGPLVAQYQASGETGLNLLAGNPVIKGTTSSTSIDLYGSRMAATAVEAMRKDGATHLTTFLNHEYTIPESILGSMTSATTQKRRGDDGVVYTDLDLVSSVVDEDVNVRAMQCWRSINKNGVKLGFSIGAMVLEWEWQLPDGTTLKTDTDDDWNMYCPPTEDAVLTYTDVMLLESSLCGVPANRRSWVHSANRSMAKAARSWQMNQVRQFSGSSVTAGKVEGTSIVLGENETSNTALGAFAAEAGNTLVRIGAGDADVQEIASLRKLLADNHETMTDLMRQIHANTQARNAVMEETSVDETNELPTTVDMAAQDDVLLVATGVGVEVTNAAPEVVADPAPAAAPIEPSFVAELAALNAAAPVVTAAAPVVEDPVVPPVTANASLGSYVEPESGVFTANYDWPADDADPSGTPAVVPTAPAAPADSVALAAPTGAGDIDPFALLSRATTLVATHLTRAGAEISADNAVLLLAAHHGVTDLLVQYKLAEVPAVPEVVEASAADDTTPDLLRQMREERAAGEHILRNLRTQIEAEKVNLALHRAAGDEFQQAVKRAEQVPFGRPTQQYADMDAPVVNSLDERYSRAEAEVAAR